MFLIKFILYVTFGAIVFFLVWNSLKRIFFNQFYDYFPHQKMKNEARKPQQQDSSQKKSTSNKKSFWKDAETIDYEEIK